MKVGDRPDAAPALQMRGPATLAKGRSFSQMIESGRGGHSIASSRALGFGEDGLLGLHFAQRNSIRAHHNAPKVTHDIECGKVAEQHEPEAFPLPRGDAGLSIKSRLNGQFRDLNGVGAGSHGDASSSPYGTAGGEAEAIKFESIDMQEFETLARCQRQLPRSARSPLWVTGGPSEVLVLVDDPAIADLDAESLEDLAQRVAVEFSMRVHKIVVHPQPRPHSQSD